MVDLDLDLDVYFKLHEQWFQTMVWWFAHSVSTVWSSLVSPRAMVNLANQFSLVKRLVNGLNHSSKSQNGNFLILR